MFCWIKKALTTRHEQLIATGYKFDNFDIYRLSGWQRPSAEELRESGYDCLTYPGGVSWSHGVSFTKDWVDCLTDEEFERLIEASKEGFRGGGPTQMISRKKGKAQNDS